MTAKLARSRTMVVGLCRGRAARLVQIVALETVRQGPAVTGFRHRDRGNQCQRSVPSGNAKRSSAMIGDCRRKRSAGSPEPAAGSDGCRLDQAVVLGQDSGLRKPGALRHRNCGCRPQPADTLVPRQFTEGWSATARQHIVQWRLRCREDDASRPADKPCAKSSLLTKAPQPTCCVYAWTLCRDNRKQTIPVRVVRPNRPTRTGQDGGLSGSNGFVPSFTTSAKASPSSVAIPMISRLAIITFSRRAPSVQVFARCGIVSR